MDWLAEILSPEGRSPQARLFRGAHWVLLVVGVGSVVAGTVQSIDAAHARALATLFDAALAFFLLEFVTRLICLPGEFAAAGHRHPVAARLEWLTSVQGVIDLAGVIPVLALFDLGWSIPHLIGMLWILKLIYHSPRLGILGRVLRQAREPLTSVLFAFLIVLFLAATLAYLAENGTQPDKFDNIPDAMWWVVTTLTTTGYGDVVPVTPLGRLLGGAVMVCGISVFALLAGILATEFSQEMRRHDFLRTWDLVAKVPFFHNLGADLIAEVTRLLKPREVVAGAVIMRRGEPGERMHFIVSGQVEIQLKPKSVYLGPGSFFGEIALLTRGPRTATVVAVQHTVLLDLDIADFRELAAKRPELTRAIDEEASRRVEQARPAK